MIPSVFIQTRVLIIIVNFHMGNSASTPTYDLDLRNDYEQVGNARGGTLLKNKQNKSTFLLRQYTFPQNQQFVEQRKRMQQQLSNGQNEHVLSLVKIYTHTFQGLCSTTHKIHALYEYPKLTLYDQIVARQKEDKMFDEQQLISIALCCLNGLKHNKSTFNFHCKDIFINQEGTLQMIHNDMIDPSPRFEFKQDIYYAPEKLGSFYNYQSEAGQIKEAVFSLGMLILQAALLQTTLDCYDKQKQQFIANNLQCLIQHLNPSYSSSFVELLLNILKIDPEQRIALSELNRMLQLGETDGYGSSLNIHTYNDNPKVNLFTSVDQRGIINNLATINSSQKQTITHNLCLHSQQDALSPNQLQNIVPRSVTSVDPNSSNVHTIADSTRNSFNRAQNTLIETKVNKPDDKQNLYTDPKLIAMIKRDLESISKLKSSQLMQNTLFPTNTNIFNSIQDITRVDNSTKGPKNKNTPKQTSTINSKQSRVASKESQMELSSVQFCKKTDQQGRNYQGYTLNGMKNGWGRLMFEDGAYYQGEFKEDQINGRGALFYQAGRPAYEGTWLKGQFHGAGTLYNQNPLPLHGPFRYQDFDQVQDFWIKYQGEFDCDNKSGNGRLFLTNGQIMQGCFLNDSLNGYCKFLRTNGETIQGCWEMNRLVQRH